jgi:hypothetical protein
VSIPSLPTDRLYKVKAIGGVALIIAGTSLVFNARQSVEARWSDYEIRFAEERVLGQFVHEDADELFADRGQLTLDTLLALRERLREVSMRNEVGSAELESIKRLNAIDWSRAKAGYFASFLGLLFSSWGFFQWGRHERAEAASGVPSTTPSGRSDA